MCEYAALPYLAVCGEETGSLAFPAHLGRPPERIEDRSAEGKLPRPLPLRPAPSTSTSTPPPRHLSRL
jgi:hypothetical protein